MSARASIRSNKIPSRDPRKESSRIFFHLSDGGWQRGLSHRVQIKGKKTMQRLLNAIASRIVRSE